MLHFELDNTNSFSHWHKWMRVYKLKNHSIWSLPSKIGDSFWLKNVLRIRDVVLTHFSLTYLALLALADKITVMYNCTPCFGLLLMMFPGLP